MQQHTLEQYTWNKDLDQVHFEQTFIAYYFRNKFTLVSENLKYFRSE